MRLLVLAYPTYGMNLHLNSTGDFVVLAPDEMIKILSENGWDVDVVNLSNFQTDKPLMRSKKIMKNINGIDVNGYDLCWHMLRDPTQPEVFEIVSSLKIPSKIINNVEKVKDLYKRMYLPILFKNGIGPKILSDSEAAVVRWERLPNNSLIDANRKAILVWDYNNNRGDYACRRDRSHVPVEFLDSSMNGIRSFFRVGFSIGEVTEGFMYSSPDSLLIQKSGTCPDCRPHIIPKEFNAPIVESMSQLGIDVAHLEGCYVNDQLKIFDINPYPTSYGKTLGKVSLNICHRMIKASANKEIP